MEGLASRGQESTDLLVHLFNAFKQAGDGEFVKYIKEKESQYEEGQEFTPT